MSRFILTGTGRCGTKWCATVLRLQGIHCGHEQVFTTSMLPEMQQPMWRDYDGDASLAAMPFLDSQRYRKITVIRHPLRTIESFLKAGPFLENSQPQELIDYLRERTDIMESKTDVEAAAKYWLYWNTECLDRSDTFLRIEWATPEYLTYLVGKEPRWEPFPVNSINATSPDENLKVDWRKIPPKLRGYIKDIAHHIGYEV